jgi:hypothetical protein
MRPWVTGTTVGGQTTSNVTCVHAGVPVTFLRVETATRTGVATVLMAVGTLLPAITSETLAAEGFNSLFIGHSFFRPFAEGMPFHAEQAGVVGHTQSTVTAGGANGAPQALWEDAAKRAQIQAILDGGDVELFGMTYHPDYPTSEGYENWISYALARNPNTRIALALPWGTDPESTSAATYASAWHLGHSTAWHDLIDYLRLLYPGVEISCIPYGQSALELRLLFAGGNLPDVDFLVSATGEAIYVDSLGHADDILVELGRLVWLNAIYDVDLTTYGYEPGYITDLKRIAQAIMDAHEAAYGEPPTPGCGDAPRTGCRTAAKSTFAYRNYDDDGKDRFSYNWIQGQATSQEEFGDPGVTTQYDLCIYAGAGANLFARANVPADGTKWAPLSTKGYKYRDSLVTASGTQRILLRGHDLLPKSKIVWKGKGSGLPDLPATALPVPGAGFPLLVQISGSDSSACFETRFESAEVVTNQTDSLKLKQK